MTKRICKRCKKEIKIVVTFGSRNDCLTIIPLKRLGYCDECWEKIR